LAAALSAGPRLLLWNGTGARPCAIPIYSPKDQPLYGLGATGLAPLYVRQNSDLSGTCFVNGFVTDFCCAAVRNNPTNNTLPAFVVWPLNEQDVQAAVRFAAAYNLCVAVAGPGHEFVNRHSACGQSAMLIRTSLMKFHRCNGDSKTLTLGPGLVFDEAQRLASGYGRMLSTGWSPTVGVVGWSLGGGHGPLVRERGRASPLLRG
jgi:ribonuclease T2